MPNLSIKNVPEEVVEKLRQRATRHHRSLQGELMDLVCRFANENIEAESGETRSARESGEASGWLSIDELANELANSKERQPRNVPLAVNIIRRERDSR